MVKEFATGKNKLRLAAGWGVSGHYRQSERAHWHEQSKYSCNVWVECHQSSPTSQSHNVPLWIFWKDCGIDENSRKLMERHERRDSKTGSCIKSKMMSACITFMRRLEKCLTLIGRKCQLLEQGL